MGFICFTNETTDHSIIVFHISYKFTLANNLIFNSCNNTAKLSAYAVFTDCGQCNIGDDVNAVPVTLKQILDVKITATNACDASDSVYNPISVVLDASGLFLDAKVCGEDSRIAPVTDSPVVYQWFKDGTQITPKSTFSKISVIGETGMYRVDVSRIIKYLDASNNNKVCTLTLSGSATVQVKNASQPIEAVAIRPTQRNVLAFSSSGALIDSNSNLGVLRAHVAPEQDDVDYQWFNNEQAILGANESTYNPGSKPGSYSVRVSNDSGSVVSRNFNITLKN
jgi:hypothetical protein